ncbi:hypothetical protein [Paenibacillus xylanexedens]|uniref:hypothetical protein n=1 Tax=Paenibacillus xylanexedens TaxID=528191 RepID=UPI003CFD94DE
MKSDIENMQFFRSIKHLEVGGYTSNVSLHMGRTVEDYITDHLFIFAYTTTCDACLKGLEALYNFYREHKEINLLILVNAADDNDIHILRGTFGENNVFNSKLQTLNRDLGIQGFPWGIGLNKAGQVITSYPCSTRKSVHDIIEPFSYLLGLNL